MTERAFIGLGSNIDPEQNLPAAVQRLARLGEVTSVSTVYLDLCLYGSKTLDTPELTLPDPDIIERAFLAVCLAELEPGFVHPGTDETLEAIAERLRTGAALKPRQRLTLRC